MPLVFPRMQMVAGTAAHIKANLAERSTGQADHMYTLLHVMRIKY